MDNPKKHKKNKIKKQIQYRTKEERAAEVKHILLQLTHFDLNMQYEPIKQLYKLFKIYINDAERIIVSIPFPQINRRIKGLLPLNKREDATIALIQEKA